MELIIEAAKDMGLNKTELNLMQKTSVGIIKFAAPENDPHLNLVIAVRNMLFND